jgi:signal transduction histidine kinase
MFFQGLENEVIARTGVTYLAEAIIGLLMSIAFFYFSNLYSRHYLKTWAISWLAFFIGTFSLGFVTLYGLHRADSIRLISSLISQTGNFLHILFLLLGTVEVVRVRKIGNQNLVFLLLGVVLVSVLSVLAFHNNPEPEAIQYRYLLRVLLRHFIISLCFFTIGIITLRSAVFTKSLGKRIMIVSFFSYGVVFLYYFVLGVKSMLGYPVTFPFFFGMIEMVLIGVMGMSMVMWLLEDERERLSKINSELDSFLYSTSHDLRAPIASILGLTNLARYEIKDAKAMEYILMIDERIKKLDHVIDDILKLSRSKKSDSKVEALDFNVLLKEVVSDVKFNEGAASITLDYTESALPLFSSDYNQMKMILTNLLSNAVKYHNLHQPNPVIRVRFHRVGKRVEIIVEDNGTGISKESLPRIFEMFYRGTSMPDGTGLGLYIVKEAVAKINGAISVKSELQKGTIFTLVLPNA